MRILHTSDWHLGKSIEGASRIEEQQAFLDDFVAIANRVDADMILIAGDIYDSFNPSSKAESLFYDTLKKLSDGGRRMIVVVSGNHDAPERLVAAGPLAMEHGIVMFGTPKTVVPAGTYGNNFVRVSGQGFVEVEVNGQRAVLVAVPYPSEKRLNEVLYRDEDTDCERMESYGQRLKTLFDSLSSNFREDTVNIAVSHLFAMGSVEAGSERSIQLGGSYIVEAGCFPETAQYIALGHVHKPQIVPGTKGRARYSGSPIHYSRKEIAFEKCVLLVELTPGSVAAVEEIKLPVYKPIEVWHCKNFDEALHRAEKDTKDAWVYIEIETDSFIGEQQIKRLRGLKSGILEIVPIFKAQLRQEQEWNKTEERSLVHLFSEFYSKERGVNPSQELVEMLLEIAEKEEQ